MASQAEQRQTGIGGIVEQLCSITTTGVVVTTRQELDVSSEVSITVQTSSLGMTREWQVQAWVVECRALGEDAEGRFQVTLLFSALPRGLKQLLICHEHEASGRPFPVVKGGEIFGLN